MRFILSDYVDKAMEQAIYDKLEDGTFTGRIPPCAGVIAFGSTLRECERELRSTLEDWILLGLKLRHPLPVIAGIDLNQEPKYEPVDTVSTLFRRSDFYSEKWRPFWAVRSQ